MTLYFEYNPVSGRSEIVEQPLKPKAVFRVGPDLKVSCQKAELCRSSSKRERGFVCGSGYSHNDRVCSCVEYLRLHRGVHGGVRGGRPL